ncbi:MAG: 16S rRNA (cytosine(1402)-N(4))-methyltransferase RsmH [Dehalococcoidia bacterium]|nr:16S rRNA (cytosine(1402)-N(4))-methyltransferase RsmH [Dehalococcoidia bacterium]
MTTTKYHNPVLLEEVKQALNLQLGGRYVDCTLGTGGHSMSILEEISPGGQLLGIDADSEAIAITRERLDKYGQSLALANDNFKNLKKICVQHNFNPVNGILFDLGLSSLQLGDASRGFSFQTDGPLDMRFSLLQKLTAADIVNTTPQAKLAQLIEDYGEDYRGRQIAKRIVEERPITSTLQLAHLIRQSASKSHGKINPATKTFQALRIAVNRELGNLKTALEQSIDLLGFNGRLVVISYHSLEDRIVKDFMRREAKDCICPPLTPTCVCGHTATLKIIGKGIITPPASEIKANPRSRSAKMRIAERI